MKKGIGQVGLGAVLWAGLLFACPVPAQAAPVLPEGVSAGGQSLAGMDAEDVRSAIESAADRMDAQTITFQVEGESVQTTAGELGLQWDNEAELQQETSKYMGGSLIHQYMVKKDLETAPVELEVSFSLDPEKVKAFVEQRCDALEDMPKNAEITRENGSFVITEGQSGKAVDLEETQRALDEAVDGGLTEPVVIEAQVTEQTPQITAEALRTIQDTLGTFTTDFSSSGAARSTNLTVGAAKLNGRILMPGEVLSGYECLQPFTEENGYQTAAAYENGQVVDSIGGGVCQISTTLYNAALEAELEIVQRQNHSMIVTYVEPSRDAAIAGTYKDLKIKNNYSTPIYVEGYTEGKKITFTIYGKETRPANREVTYVSETLGTINPGDPQLIVDNSLAPGQRVRVQSSHTGRRSRLWKVVTVDGEETERTLLNTDTYNASKAVYRVGPAAPAATAPAETPPEETTGAAETTGASEAAETTGASEAAETAAGEITQDAGSGGPGVTGQPSADAGAPAGEAAPASETAGEATAPSENGSSGADTAAPAAEAPAASTQAAPAAAEETAAPAEEAAVS